MKPSNGNPDNQERQKLRDYLVANGLSIGGASRLTAPGQNRKKLSDGLIEYLKNSPKAK